MGEITEAQLTDEQAEEAERIIGYHEGHTHALAEHPAPERTVMVLEDAVKLLREILPEWSAFKEVPTYDCTSAGFSGEGRCIERAVVSRTEPDGPRRVCWPHYIAPEYRAATEVSA